MFIEIDCENDFPCLVIFTEMSEGQKEVRAMLATSLFTLRIYIGQIDFRMFFEDN
jgi:hypothetical protein